MKKKYLYSFVNFADKREAVEQAIRNANGEPFDHPSYPGEICFRSDKSPDEQGLRLLRAKADSVASSIKLRGPLQDAL